MSAKLDVIKNYRVVVFCAFVAFGGFLFGYDIGVISGLLIQPDFIKRFGEEDADGTWVLSSSRQSLITSLLSAGTFFGAPAQAFTSDRFGRKGSIFCWSAIFTVGVAIQTGCERSLPQMLVGRFIAGLGVGAMSAIVPLYNGETSPKALRGFLLVFYQVQIITGIFFSYILDAALHTVQSSVAWRVPIGLQILYGLVLCSGILFLPESPRLLLGRGDEEGARRSISIINNVSTDDPIVQEEIEDLAYGLQSENEGGKATWLECFSTRNILWKRTLNGMMLMVFQQLNGQNFYYYYGPTFFKASGTLLSSYSIQLILGGVSLAGTMPALWAIDNVGRRNMMFYGAIFECGCALIAGLVGYYTAAADGTAVEDYTSRNKSGGGVLIAFAVLQIFGYSLFWGPTPWVYLGESFPLRIRPKAIALGSATNWLWNFLLAYFSPGIADRLGPLILCIFAGILALAAAYVYLMIPETRGLSLEEVDAMYQSGVPPWRSSTWKPPVEEEKVNDKGEIIHLERRKAPKAMMH